MHRDPLGLPVTLADAASAPALDDFVEGFLACETRVGGILAAAERDDAPLVQAYAAMFQMFAETPQAPAAARPYLERALDAATAATERERGFVAAIDAWADGDIARALECHEALAALAPRDLVSVKLAQYHAFNLGDSPRMLRLVLPAREAAADVPWVHGMTAFAFEQCHRLADAEAAARRGIAMRRKEPWAHHALAHVMLTEGRIDEGESFMREMSDTWTDLNSFMVTHNWWHLALFLIEQDRIDEALALYDREVWGVCPQYSQDQIGAVSLLARLELADADVGDRWRALAPFLAARTHDQVQPFLDLHYLYGLARAQRPEADELLASLATHAARAPALTAGAWRDVALPAAHGLLAHARGDWNAAIAGLGAALPRMVEIGGSHAQRDLFEQLWIGALVRAGRWSTVQHLLQQRARACPQSRRLSRQLAPVYRALGLASLASS